jgi:hypothetical protein
MDQNNEIMKWQQCVLYFNILRTYIKQSSLAFDICCDEVGASPPEQPTADARVRVARKASTPPIL